MRSGSKGSSDGRRTISRGKRATTIARIKGPSSDSTGQDESDTFESLVKRSDGVKKGIRARVDMILSARNDKLTQDTWNDSTDELEFEARNGLVFDPDVPPAYEDMDYDNNPVLLHSKVKEFKRTNESVKSASLIVTPFQKNGVSESKDSDNTFEEEEKDRLLSHCLDALHEVDELEESSGQAGDDSSANHNDPNMHESDHSLQERRRHEEDAKVVTKEDMQFIDSLKMQISMADIPLVISASDNPKSHWPADSIPLGVLSSDNVKRYFGPDSKHLFYDTYQSLAKTAQICSGGIDELARYISDPSVRNPFIESAKLMVAGGLITPRKDVTPEEAAAQRSGDEAAHSLRPSAGGAHFLLMARQATHLEEDETVVEAADKKKEDDDGDGDGDGDDAEGFIIDRWGEVMETVDSSFHDAQLNRLMDEAPPCDEEAGDALDDEVADTDGPDTVAPFQLAEGDSLLEHTQNLLELEETVERIEEGEAEADDEEYDLFATEQEVYPCGVYGCNVPAQYFCSGCNEVTYCSHEHQFVHWEVHSVSCRHTCMPTTERTARSGMGSARIETARKPLSAEEAYMEEIPSLSSYRPQSPRATFILGLMKLGVAPRAVVMLRKSMTSTLNITNMGLGDRLAEAFSSSVHKLPGIRGLNLSNNSLTDRGMTIIIKNLYKMEALEDIDLSSNVIGDNAAQALADYLSSDCCRIKRLKVMHANVDDDECDRFVSALVKNAYLHELDLSHNLLGKSENLNEVNPDFTTAGESLGLLLKAPNVKLKRLVLRWNMMRMGGAIALCESLKLNESLVHLDLAFNKIGTPAAIVLGISLLNEGFSLEYLNLQNNIIDGRAAIAVIVGAKYSGIKHLILDDNPIGEQAGRLLVQTIRDYGDQMNISCKKCDVVIQYPDTHIDFGHIKGTYTFNCEDGYERLLAYELLDVIPRSNAHVVQGVTLGDGKSLILPACRKKKKFNIHDPALDEIKRLKYLSEFSKVGLYPHVLHLFRASDRGGKGFLFDRDLRHMLMKLGLHYHLYEVRDFIKMFDTNGNGVIELGELEQFLRHLGRYSNKLLKSLSSTSNISDIKSELKALVQAGSTSVTIAIAEKWDVSLDHDHHITSSTQLKYMITAADQSLNPVKMMEYAADAVGTILYYNEAKDFMDYFMTVDTDVVGLTHVLPCMESPDDALNIVRKYLDMNKSKRKLLANALGNAYNVCTGNFNGSYFMDFSKKTDRIAMRKLLIASHKFAEFAERKKLFDISDTGDKSSFRNAFFFEKYAYVNCVLTLMLPLSESDQSKHVNQNVAHLDTILSFLKAFNGIPDKGKADFDFSAVTNIDTFYHHKGISDAKFLRVLTEGSLCRRSEVADLQNKMKFNDHSLLYRDYGELTSLFDSEHLHEELEAVKHLRHMIKYKEHRRAEVIEKKAFKPPEHEDDLISASSLDEGSAQVPDDVSGQFSIDITDDASAFNKQYGSNHLPDAESPMPATKQPMLDMYSINADFYQNNSKMSYAEMLGVASFSAEGQRRAQKRASGEVDEATLTIQDALKAALRDPSCSPVWKCQLITEYLRVQLFHRSIFVRQLLILLDILEEIDIPMTCLYFPSYSVELLVNFFPKVIDAHNMHLVYRRLKPVDQAAFMFRVGIVRTFNVFKPEGHYFLDISHREQRTIFKIILFLYKMDSSTHALSGDYTLTGRTQDMHRLEINPNYWLKEGLYDNAIYKISFLPKTTQACKAWLKDVQSKLIKRYKLLVCGSLNQQLLHEDIQAGKVGGEGVACLLDEPINTVEEANAMLDSAGIEWRFI